VYSLYDSGTERKIRYLKWEGIALKIVLGILLLAAVGVCICGIIGNVYFNKYFTTASGSLRFTLLETLNRTSDIYITLADAGLLDPTLVSEQVSALNESEVLITTLVKEVRTMNVFRYFMMFVIIAAVLLGHILAIVSGIFKIKVCIFIVVEYIV
jgi:hypothetical protein